MLSASWSNFRYFDIVDPVSNMATTSGLATVQRTQTGPKICFLSATKKLKKTPDCIDKLAGLFGLLM